MLKSNYLSKILNFNFGDGDQGQVNRKLRLGQSFSLAPTFSCDRPKNGVCSINFTHPKFRALTDRPLELLFRTALISLQEKEKKYTPVKCHTKNELGMTRFDHLKI